MLSYYKDMLYQLPISGRFSLQAKEILGY